MALPHPQGSDRDDRVQPMAIYFPDRSVPRGRARYQTGNLEAATLADGEVQANSVPMHRSHPQREPRPRWLGVREYCRTTTRPEKSERLLPAL